MPFVDSNKCFLLLLFCSFLDDFPSLNIFIYNLSKVLLHLLHDDFPLTYVLCSTLLTECAFAVDGWMCVFCIILLWASLIPFISVKG